MDKEQMNTESITIEIPKPKLARGDYVFSSYRLSKPLSELLKSNEMEIVTDCVCAGYILPNGQHGFKWLVRVSTFAVRKWNHSEAMFSWFKEKEIDSIFWNSETRRSMPKVGDLEWRDADSYTKVAGANDNFTLEMADAYLRRIEQEKAEKEERAKQENDEINRVRLQDRLTQLPIECAELADISNQRTSGNKGYVYFVKLWDYDLFKIGKTTNVNRRIVDLGRQYGTLSLYGCIKTSDMNYLESNIHNLLSDYRRTVDDGNQRELFDVSEDFVSSLLEMSGYEIGNDIEIEHNITEPNLTAK